MNLRNRLQVTNVWINTIMVVDQDHLYIYVNGAKVDESEFGFFIGNQQRGIPVECRNNAGCNPQTGNAITDHLSTPMGTITMHTPIYLGQLPFTCNHILDVETLNSDCA
eukprot:SAG31_NODE_2949_length_4871_cov_2.742456_7_plen_109_part_00